MLMRNTKYPLARACQPPAITGNQFYLLYATKTVMKHDWRKRLLDAVDRDGRSDRAISIAASLGVNFVNELRNTEKEPSVEKILRLANEINTSLSFVFLGADATKEDDQLISIISHLPQDEKVSLLEFLRSRSNKNPQ